MNETAESEAADTPHPKIHSVDKNKAKQFISICLFEN